MTLRGGDGGAGRRPGAAPSRKKPDRPDHPGAGRRRREERHRAGRGGGLAVGRGDTEHGHRLGRTPVDRRRRHPPWPDAGRRPRPGARRALRASRASRMGRSAPRPRRPLRRGRGELGTMVMTARQGHVQVAGASRRGWRVMPPAVPGRRPGNRSARPTAGTVPRPQGGRRRYRSRRLTVRVRSERQGVHRVHSHSVGLGSLGSASGGDPVARQDHAHQVSGPPGPPYRCRCRRLGGW